MTDKQMIDEETLIRILKLKENRERIGRCLSRYFSDEQPETVSVAVNDRNDSWIELDREDLKLLLKTEFELATTQLKQLGFSPTPPTQGGE